MDVGMPELKSCEKCGKVFAKSPDRSDAVYEGDCGRIDCSFGARMQNAQTNAWEGDFGDEYVQRSPGNAQANEDLFKRVLITADTYEHIKSVIEFGCGAGSNLVALHRILNAEMVGVEINPRAAARAANLGVADIYRKSMFEWTQAAQYDLVFTKGLLIHIPPADLPRAYAVLYQASRRYILTAEYYCPKPREIQYRGRENMLWACDFAGEMLDRYTDLTLLGYGFVYHRDKFPQDDITWFLMEKKQ